MKNGKVYLGDGVYASWDGYHIVLTTENGIETTNTIYLDSSVIEALIKYHRKRNET
jgi:hypothetical protein